MTLEDPVEFVHPQRKATFNQREMGSDFSTFAAGLRAALRQAPKVILVGEMRDRETVEIGLSAAETGHLVMSTLHTINAGQTINRIVGMFDQEEQHQIRIRLAETLRWVVSQRLLPKIGGGRVAALEIMGNSLRVKDSIEHGEAEGKTFYEIIEASATFGWKTFDMAVLELYEQGLITEETALLYCSNKGVVSRGIDKIKKIKGQATTNIGGLNLDLAIREEKMSTSELSKMDFFELGDKTSLVCADPSTTESVRGNVEGPGIQIARCGNRRNGDRTHPIHAVRHHCHPRKLRGKLSAVQRAAQLSGRCCPWRNGAIPLSA